MRGIGLIDMIGKTTMKDSMRDNMNANNSNNFNNSRNSWSGSSLNGVNIRNLNVISFRWLILIGDNPPHNQSSLLWPGMMMLQMKEELLQHTSPHQLISMALG